MDGGRGEIVPRLIESCRAPARGRASGISTRRSEGCRVATPRPTAPQQLRGPDEAAHPPTLRICGAPPHTPSSEVSTRFVARQSPGGMGAKPPRIRGRVGGLPKLTAATTAPRCEARASWLAARATRSPTCSPASIAGTAARSTAASPPRAPATPPSAQCDRPRMRYTEASTPGSRARSRAASYQLRMAAITRPCTSTLSARV